MFDRLRPYDAVLGRLQALHPQGIELSLDRIERLLARLGHPERRLPPVVHVAGTNGKGSTVAFLRAMAEAAGLLVHAYTSPHLVQFAERIRLAGALIPDGELVELLGRVEAANAGAATTFFELTTAAAFVAFAERPADLCLVEVGMGGRYDATNVIDRPEMSVITPIAFDHCEYLGDTLAKIAGEKAGIIKAGAPCICADQDEDALAVLSTVAEDLLVPLTVAGRDFHVRAVPGGIEFQDRDGTLQLPPPCLLGVHQVRNAGVAIAAARRLALSEASIAEGLTSAQWPARMQRLRSGPLAELAAARGADLWLDGAHNPHAAAAVAATLAQWRRAKRNPLVVVLGLLARKDARAVLAEFKAIVPLRLILVGFDAPGVAEPTTLLHAAHAVGLEAEVRQDVTAAVKAALECNSGPPPRIVICGSLYMAGDVLAMQPKWPT